MRRALAALAVTAALAVGAGAAYASGTTASRTMHERMTQVPAGSMDMSPMDMSPMDMSPMDMSSTDMDAMHTQMRTAMPADLAASCDAAHGQMTLTPGPAESDPSPSADHAAHHPAS